MATTLVALAFAILFGIGWDKPRLFFFCFAVLMSQLSISSLNDWADRDLDRAAGRRRPVPMGKVPPAVALGLAILLALCGLPAAAATGLPALAAFFIGLAAGWSYDLFFKRTPLSFLPFAVAFPLIPIWAGLVAGRALPHMLAFYLVGAPLAVAIHLADSIADLASDSASGVRNLAVSLGSKRSVVVLQAAVVLAFLVVAVSLARQIPIAVVSGVVTLAGIWLAARTAAAHLNRTRWVVTLTALGIAIPWLTLQA